MKAQRHLLLIGLLITAALVVGVATAFTRGNDPRDRKWDVSSAALANSGITLTAASSSLPPANSVVPNVSRALDVATADAGVAARAAEYAHCDDPGMDPPVSQDCWAVSLDPSSFHSHGPDGAKSIQATYAVDLIDPASGRILDRTSGKP